MNITIKTIVLLALLLPFASASAKSPPCEQLPGYVREAARNMSYCIAAEQPVPVCGRANINLQVFDNDERRLPSAGRGQTYYEGRAQRDPGGAPGAYRLVFLVTDGNSKIEQRYYSPDHYGSFCSIR